MNAHIGNSFLWIALLLSLYSGGAALVSTRTKDARLLASARRGVYAIFAVYLAVTVIIIRAFLTDDFSLEYVATHSSRVLPRFYAATGLWSGMEGSLTFWSLLLAGFSAWAIYRNQERARAFIPWVILTLTGMQVFFTFVQLWLSNPLELTAGFVPADGRGMNPQLQNPGMAFHPPTLYLGYVGCAIPFAFAMAALFTNRLDDLWIRLTRRMMLTAWLFLSIGILLGAWWAYVELGWGGYWAWDPVENASLLPWLTATAYLHSVMIQERRGMLKVWNMVLVFLTFFMSVLGTFLTRSGFVQSVHSFAGSSIGWYFLGFMVLILLYFLVPFLIRLPSLQSTSRLESLLSKEASFLYNNWLLVGILTVVLIGTLGEPISKLFTGVATTFRGPYFNALNVPLGIMLLFLTGIGPAIAWRRATAANLKRNFFFPVVLGLVVAVLFVVAGYAFGFLDLVNQAPHRYAVMTVFSCVFVAAIMVAEYYKGARIRRGHKGIGYFKALVEITRQNGRRYGGYVIHLGIVCMFAGFAGSAFNYEVQKALKPGESMHVGGYELTYASQKDVSRATYQGLELRMDIREHGSFSGTVGLQKRFYIREQQPTTEVAIRSKLLEDLYLILISVEKDNTAVIKAQVNPLVAWIWFGGFLMVFGTAIAMLPTMSEQRAVAAEIALQSAQVDVPVT